VEYFRPDRRNVIYRVAGIGILLITVGVLSIGLGRSGASLGLGSIAVTIFWVVGACCTFAGPVSVIIGFGRATGGDDYLALRNDGVAYNTSHGVAFLAWADVEAIESESDLLVIRGTSGREIRLDEAFGDLKTAKLVIRIERVRQKALMGLLRPPVEQPIRRR
jgi:hypothetical protein